MAIGVVSDSDFETEVNKVRSINPIGQVVDKTPLGRGNSLEVPDSLRKVIGETGAVDGRQEALALGRMFGISPSAASAYANGANSTTTYDTPNPGIKSVINKRKERISRRASKVLNASLDELANEDKLKDVKAIELSTIARNMASIVKDMEPEIEKGPSENGGPTFVLYAPQFTKEERYDVINLNE